MAVVYGVPLFEMEILLFFLVCDVVFCRSLNFLFFPFLRSPARPCVTTLARHVTWPIKLIPDGRHGTTRTAQTSRHGNINLSEQEEEDISIIKDGMIHKAGLKGEVAFRSVCQFSQSMLFFFFLF